MDAILDRMLVELVRLVLLEIEEFEMVGLMGEVGEPLELKSLAGSGLKESEIETVESG